jgi:hypothetical protein
MLRERLAHVEHAQRSGLVRRTRLQVSRFAAEEIDKLRTQADGRFLSASYAGVYRKTQHAGESRSISPKERSTRSYVPCHNR